MTLLSHALRTLLALAGLASTLASPRLAAAQDAGPRVRYILSIGNYPRVDGIRLNFRDGDLNLVRGANITLWQPYDGEWSGTVKGLAIGLPSTGARDISGFGAGILGLAASHDIFGIALGGIGVGAGNDLRGIAIGGIGAGVGGDVRGAAAGIIGVGAGGNVAGLIIGGIGAGAGGNVRGIAFGGVGVGAGGDASGLLIGGIGVGAGGDATGILLGGVGVGAGGDMTGVALGLVGVGAGGRVRGLALGGIGVGAPEIEGIAVGSMVGAEEVTGFVFAPVYFRTEVGGRITGATVSAVNRVRGDLSGLSIGLVNYAWAARGVQLGVVNIIRDNPRGRKVLPIVNWGSR